MKTTSTLADTEGLAMDYSDYDNDFIHFMKDREIYESAWPDCEQVWDHCRGEHKATLRVYLDLVEENAELKSRISRAKEIVEEAMEQEETSILKCDAHFVYEIWSGGKLVPVLCGVTYDYADDTGQEACLVFAKINEWNVISLIDKEVREDIEQFSLENAYEIEQRMTHNSMRTEK
mgnify:CR=1 FL=1